MVKQFCYLGDMISAGGGTEPSTIARVRSGWKSFRVLLPLLTSQVISIETKGRFFAACVVLWFMVVRPGFLGGTYYQNFSS